VAKAFAGASPATVAVAVAERRGVPVLGNREPEGVGVAVRFDLVQRLFKVNGISVIDITYSEGIENTIISREPNENFATTLRHENENSKGPKCAPARRPISLPCARGLHGTGTSTRRGRSGLMHAQTHARCTPDRARGRGRQPPPISSFRHGGQWERENIVKKRRKKKKKNEG
jgi:hypothetical protein